MKEEKNIYYDKFVCRTFYCFFFSTVLLVSWNISSENIIIKTSSHTSWLGCFSIFSDRPDAHEKKPCTIIILKSSYYNDRAISHIRKTGWRSIHAIDIHVDYIQLWWWSFQTDNAFFFSIFFFVAFFFFSFYFLSHIRFDGSISRKLYEIIRVAWSWATKTYLLFYTCSPIYYIITPRFHNIFKNKN